MFIGARWAPSFSFAGRFLRARGCPAGLPFIGAPLGLKSAASVSAPSASASLQSLQLALRAAEHGMHYHKGRACCSACRTSPKLKPHACFGAGAVLITVSNGPTLSGLFTMFVIVQTIYGIGVGGEYPVASSSANERANSYKCAPPAPQMPVQCCATGRASSWGRTSFSLYAVFWCRSRLQKDLLMWGRDELAMCIDESPTVSGVCLLAAAVWRRRTHAW
jgi:MFS family permease